MRDQTDIMVCVCVCVVCVCVVFGCDQSVIVCVCVREREMYQTDIIACVLCVFYDQADIRIVCVRSDSLCFVSVKRTILIVFVCVYVCVCLCLCLCLLSE